MRYMVNRESTVALYDIADSLLDIGAKDAAQKIADAAYALHRANGEISCVTELLERPRKHKQALRDWREDVLRLGWGEADDIDYISPWHPSSLERDAVRWLEDRVVERTIEDVKTDAV